MRALATARTAIKVGLVALVPFMGPSDPVAAGPLEDGQAAYDRGNYATALLLWRAFADQGDASAQYNLGVMYEHGQGVPRNYSAALAWFRKAAAQSHAGAQYNVGVMYADGLGVSRNFATAVTWYREAADQGYASAQSSLGVMYALGKGVPQDDG